MIDQLKETITRYWGFNSLRPLQEQAMQAVLDGTDSLVVLPTGGGKSLCYQAPAVLRGGTTVVVSPLIALMKDQVDGLRACGIAAVQLDSSLSSNERFAYEMDLRQGGINLLFVSPERLIQTDLYKVLLQIGVRTFAIDEAHCISHWGHDFRPEYRQLALLRDHFPGASVHAYTATATEQVRGDIIKQLALKKPAILVGNFDRPNLTYRVLPRQDPCGRCLMCSTVTRARRGSSIACAAATWTTWPAPSRKRGSTACPTTRGWRARNASEFRRNLRRRRCDVIVATVAFGMGIDRSNVRFVLHTDLPKSLEHYQQETGRAGRDGLEAECVLLYSGGDVMAMRRIIQKSAEEAGAEPEFLAASFRHLDDIDRYARGAICRHRALVQYFGQQFDRPACAACDVCLGDTEPVPDATVVAQKILSCVARVKENFGVGHVVSVLRGENTEGVRKWKHDQLTTFALLKENSKQEVRDWIHQLIGQRAVGADGRRLPAAQAERRLMGSDARPAASAARFSWPADRRTNGRRNRRAMKRPGKASIADCSMRLRELRRTQAAERGVPPYLIFSDNTLRELARYRPSTLPHMHLIYGVGEAKLRDFGQAFLDRIADHCRQFSLTQDVPRAALPPPPPPRPAGIRLTARLSQAFDLFRENLAIEDVMHQMQLSRSTVVDYLAQYIREEKPASIAAWVADDMYQRVSVAARQQGLDRLKPIFIALEQKVDYATIQLVVAHLQGQAARS